MNSECNHKVCTHQCDRYEKCKNTWDITTPIEDVKYSKLHHVMVFIDKDKEPVFSMTYILGDKKAEDRITDVMAKMKKFYGTFCITKIDMEVSSCLSIKGSVDP